MSEQTHKGGATFVRLPSTPHVFRAEEIIGTWNGFPVPTFTHSEVWGIFHALQMEGNTDYHGHTSFRNEEGKLEFVEQHGNGDYSFNGWVWEIVGPVSVEVVDALSGQFMTLVDMGIVTGAMMDVVEAWLAPHSGEYAQDQARLILFVFAETVRDEVVTWELFESRYFRVLTELVKNS